MAGQTFITSPTRPHNITAEVDSSSVSVLNINTTPTEDLVQVKVASKDVVDNDSSLASAKEKVLKEASKPPVKLIGTSSDNARSIITTEDEETANKLSELQEKLDIQAGTSADCPDWGCLAPDFDLDDKIKGLRFGLKIPDWLKFSFKHKDNGVLARIIRCTTYLANEGINGYNKISGTIANLGDPKMYKELMDTSSGYDTNNWKKALGYLPKIKNDLRKVINLAGGDGDKVADVIDMMESGEITSAGLLGPDNSYPSSSTYATYSSSYTADSLLDTQQYTLADFSNNPGLTADYSSDPVKLNNVSVALGVDRTELGMATVVPGMVNAGKVTSALTPTVAGAESTGVINKYSNLGSSPNNSTINSTIVESEASPGNVILSARTSSQSSDSTTEVDMANAIRDIKLGNRAVVISNREQDIQTNNKLLRGERSAVDDVVVHAPVNVVKSAPEFQSRENVGRVINAWFTNKHEAIMQFSS